ncbi:MAG: hypothetical protein ACFFCS_13895 [Candidatus Hodarchaeota archaeon]
MEEKNPKKWMILGFFPILGGILCYDLFFFIFQLSEEKPPDFSLIFTYLGPTLILMGGLMMNKGWGMIPILSELNLLLKLEHILIVHPTSKEIIFNHPFKKDSSILSGNEEIISGKLFIDINHIISEAISAQDQIKSIQHGGKFFLFSRLLHSLHILLALEYSDEIKYRLEKFAVKFEENFFPKLKEKQNLDPKNYIDAEEIISEFFA